MNIKKYFGNSSHDELNRIKDVLQAMYKKQSRICEQYKNSIATVPRRSHEETKTLLLGNALKACFGESAVWEAVSDMQKEKQIEKRKPKEPYTNKDFKEDCGQGIREHKEKLLQLQKALPVCDTDDCDNIADNESFWCTPCVEKGIKMMGVSCKKKQ
jgi:hypothetical protein